MSTASSTFQNLFAGTLTMGTSTSWATAGILRVGVSGMPIFDISSSTDPNGSATTSLFSVLPSGLITIPGTLIASGSSTIQYLNSASGTVATLLSTKATATDLYATRATIDTGTFTTAPLFSSLSSHRLAVTSSGVVYAAATTTFSTGLTYLNGEVTNAGVLSLAQTSGTAQVGAITFGTSSDAIANDWGIRNSGGDFIIQLPTASVSVRGLLSSTDWSTFNNKSGFAYPFTQETTYTGVSTSTLINFAGGLMSNYSSSTIQTLFSTQIGIWSTTPWGRFSVEMDATNPTLVVSNQGSTTPALYIGGVNQNGFIGIGTTTPNAPFTIDNNGLRASSSYQTIGGISQYMWFDPSILSTTQFGDFSYITYAPSATSTMVGKMIKVEDNTSLGNTVRGLEVQAHRGTNTQGENTAISAFGRTFGIRTVTQGDAGAVYAPAALYAETRGTTQGNAARFYSSSITTADLISLFTDTSSFSGNGLVMNFGNSGSFNGNFLNLKNAGTSEFIVKQAGQTGVGTSTPWAMLSVTASSTVATEYALAVSDSNEATKLVVTNAGNVGIGTTPPGSILAIGATGAGVNFSVATSTFNTTGGLNLTNGCFAVDGACLTSGGDTLPSGTEGQTLSYVGTTLTATSSIFLKVNGAVGIGTSTPLTSLSIQGTAGMDLLDIASSTAASLFYITAFGQVGIGTRLPTALFSIANTASSTLTKSTSGDFSAPGSTATQGVATSSGQITLNLATTTSDLGPGSMTAAPALEGGSSDTAQYGSHSLVRRS